MRDAILGGWRTWLIGRLQGSARILSTALSFINIASFSLSYDLIGIGFSS